MIVEIEEDGVDRSAWIRVTHDAKARGIGGYALLWSFLEYGWHPRNTGGRISWVEIERLAAGEIRSPRMQRRGVDDEGAFLKRMEELGETWERALVNLYWNDATGPGGSFSFGEDEIYVGIEAIGRMTLPGEDQRTWFEWYRERVVGPLERAGVGVGKVTWGEIS